MSGDRLIQLYSEIHAVRADVNTAVSEENKTAERMARAKLRDLNASVDFYFREPAKRPLSRYA